MPDNETIDGAADTMGGADTSGAGEGQEQGSGSSLADLLDGPAENGGGTDHLIRPVGNVEAPDVTASADTEAATDQMAPPADSSDAIWRAWVTARLDVLEHAAGVRPPAQPE